ncbi:MAG: EAL domain-containing protein [Gammaproteobacteria bacterium]
MDAGEPATAESLGWQLRAALPPMRLHSVSLYNVDADVLFLSEGALGPDEHNVVVEAIEGQKADKTQSYHEYGMEDGRMAVFLPIRGPRNDLAGTVMILADIKSLNEGTMERIVTPQIRTILVKIAMFMRKSSPASATDSTAEVTMPVSSVPAAVNPGSTTIIEKLPASAAGTLGPHEVNEMLELELVATPPRAPHAPASVAVAAGNHALMKKGAAAAAPPASKAPLRTPAPPTAWGAAPITSVPAMPARDIEVLAFEPDIQLPTAKPAASPPADIEVLAFDIEPPVVSAAPAAARPAPTASTSSVRAIDVAPSASAPAAKAAVPAVKAAPAATISSEPAKIAASEQAKKAATAASQSSVQTPVLKPAAAASRGFADSPISTSATRPGLSPSNAETAAVQIISERDVESALINDTGPVPVLLDTASIESPPQLPALEPLSIEESAADLTLFAQELIKLRSSGRTRRYEVLARSRRDATRNEVPAAFVAESARGKDGAALDAMVLERLLTWLGAHGEAIWDSEPASFSVNLSIGAIEDEAFPKRIEQWLQQYTVPAEYIGFEITEFACVQCRPAVQRFVEAIEKIGCFLVIDNFSFDSSIFEMLGSKALRHVKLDPKLTMAAMKDKLPQALVVAILQACKVLGVHCVAKRVESQSTMQWLTAVGCDFAQSFALQKPFPLESLASAQPIKALRE